MRKEKKKLSSGRVRKHRLKKSLWKQYQDLISARLNKKEETKIKTTQPNESFENENDSILYKLRCWAKNHIISTRAINDLLKILKSFGLSGLPADYRSFFTTPRTVQILTKANGKFWYNGLAKNLNYIFSNLNKDIVISLKFNVDGLPIFKSSNIQFWPILASIYGKYRLLLFFVIVLVPKECYLYF